MKTIGLTGMMDAPGGFRPGPETGPGARNGTAMVRRPPPAGGRGDPVDLGRDLTLPGLTKGALAFAEAYPWKGAHEGALG